MTGIITVFKNEFRNRDFVRAQIEPLCRQVQEVDNAVVFSPKDGKLFEFLTVLRFHKVAYGTHFDTNDASTAFANAETK